MTEFVLVLLVLQALTHIAAAASPARTAPAARTQKTSGLAGSPVASNPTFEDDATKHRRHAQEWAEKTRQSIVPTMHLVETEHFLIFSAWNRVNDASLASICERMYQMLNQQFARSVAEPIWVGKLPVYIFWEPEHYARFITEVDQSKAINSSTAHAHGYHARRGAFSYVVLNGASGFGASRDQALLRFYHVLVHEGTHAFLNGYVSDRSLPLWLEEGIADFVAASLVPGADVNRSYITAARAALQNPEAVHQLFDKKSDFTPADYAVAQSFVRTLAEQNRGAMIRFLALLKEGAGEKAALAEAYGTTREALIQRWAQAWQRR